jgi:hypothetical protein
VSFFTVDIAACGLIELISKAPSPVSCTTTLQGSNVPILSSVCNDLYA